MRKKVQEIVAYKTQKPVRLTIHRSGDPLIFQGFRGILHLAIFRVLSTVLSGGDFGKFAGVMELVDVADSKSAGGDTVWVRVPPPAPSSETLDPSAFEASGVSSFLP